MTELVKLLNTLINQNETQIPLDERGFFSLL